MFERFTRAAREVVVGAQSEALDLDHPRIGTEHTLLALLAATETPVAGLLHDRGVDARSVRAEIIRRVGAPEPGTTARLPDTDAEDAAALKAIGIDLDQVRRAIEENFGPGALSMLPEPEPQRRGMFRRRGHRPFSARNKKVLELALREAVRLKNREITPEHLMLGILREGQGLAAQILADAGVDFGDLRADLVRALNSPAR